MLQPYKLIRLSLSTTMFCDANVFSNTLISVSFIIQINVTNLYFYEFWTCFCRNLFLELFCCWNLKTWHRFLYKYPLLFFLTTDFTLKAHYCWFENLSIYLSSHKKLFREFHTKPAFSFWDMLILISKIFVCEHTERAEYVKK